MRADVIILTLVVGEAIEEVAIDGEEALHGRKPEAVSNSMCSTNEHVHWDRRRNQSR